MQCLKLIQDIIVSANGLKEIEIFKLEKELNIEPMILTACNFRMHTQRPFLLNPDRCAVRRCILDHLGGDVRRTENVLTVVDGRMEKAVDLPMLYLIVHDLSDSSKIDIESACNDWSPDIQQFWSCVAVHLGLEAMSMNTIVLCRLKSFYSNLLNPFDKIPTGQLTVANKKTYIQLLVENEQLLQKDNAERERSIRKEFWIKTKSNVDFMDTRDLLLEITAETSALSKIACETTAKKFLYNVIKYGCPTIYAVQAISTLSGRFDKDKSNFAEISLYDNYWFKWLALDTVGSEIGSFIMESALALQPWRCSNWGLSTAFYLYKSAKPKLWYTTKAEHFWCVYRFLTIKQKEGVSYVSVEDVENLLGMDQLNCTVQNEGELVVIPGYCFYMSICSDFSISESIDFPSHTWWTQTYIAMKKSVGLSDLHKNDPIFRWPDFDYLLYRSYQHVLSSNNALQNVEDDLLKVYEYRKRDESKHRKLLEKFSIPRLPGNFEIENNICHTCEFLCVFSQVIDLKTNRSYCSSHALIQMYQWPRRSFGVKIHVENL